MLDQARDEDVLVRMEDGSEFMLSAIDDFDHEIARTRRNEKLMALLDEKRQGWRRDIVYPTHFAYDENLEQISPILQEIIHKLATYRGAQWTP